MVGEYLYYGVLATQHFTVVSLPVDGTTHFYLDPGTGSLIIQVAIGAFVAGLFAVKVWWKRFTGFLRGLLFWSSKRDKAGG